MRSPLGTGRRKVRRQNGLSAAAARVLPANGPADPSVQISSRSDQGGLSVRYGGCRCTGPRSRRQRHVRLYRGRDWIRLARLRLPSLAVLEDQQQPVLPLPALWYLPYQGRNVRSDGRDPGTSFGPYPQRRQDTVLPLFG